MSSLLFASLTTGVLRVVLVEVDTAFCSVGVDVMILFEPGEFKNWDGENGNDFIGVQLFGLLKMLSCDCVILVTEALVVDSFTSET